MTIISSPQKMLDYASKLSQQHKKILVSGELGAGKTLFCKGFAQGIGIDPNTIQSPTYTYINIYDNKLLHIDMYRLEEYSDLVEKGILEEIHNYDFIIIERPKFDDKIDYSDFHSIQIDKLDEHTRETIEK